MLIEVQHLRLRAVFQQPGNEDVSTSICIGLVWMVENNVEKLWCGRKVLNAFLFTWKRLGIDQARFWFLQQWPAYFEVLVENSL